MSPNTVAPTNRTQALLSSARQKLRAPDAPKLLRVAAFLRISCLALDHPGAYSDLMKKLCIHQEWWMTCEVTPAGTLKSSNSAINALLEPINSLHQPQPQPQPQPQLQPPSLPLAA